jgi:hypothetical protein
MILAALATVYINTEESQAEGEAALSGTYNVYSTGNADNSTGEQLGESLINGIVIVSVICAMTFLIVLLYKYRCMKILMGYMILSSVLLLGFLSSVMFQVAIDRYELRIDTFSFYFTIFNFCVTGTAAIFFARGFPVYITQFYLIATSIIVSWQLSHFDAWTAWVLLVLLALYDLFAVLTPCGPLKALVKLMQKADAPDMPGLLYEASLPANTRRPVRASTAPSAGRASTEPLSTSTSLPPSLPPTEPSSFVSSSTSTLPTHSSDENAGQEPTPIVFVSQATSESEAFEASLAPHTETTETSENIVPGESNAVPSDRAARTMGLEASSQYTSQPGGGEPDSTLPSVLQLETQSLDHPVTSIPLALAKLYKLRLVDNPQPSWLRSSQESTTPTITATEPVEYSYSPAELHACVDVIFPRNGGRILPHTEQRPNEATRYIVLDRDGNTKRILFVSPETGRVFEDLREKNQAEENDTPEKNSIRLGLGDFIFYSILVSKAALYSFTTFAACTLAILTGLGLTLLLLAVYGKALPALPISIFLGVVFYLISRYSMEPWIQEIFIQQGYV